MTRLLKASQWKKTKSCRRCSSAGSAKPERGGGGGAVEVLNAGTAGYSTDQELLYFTREGVALEPDFTVLFVYVNDILLNTSPDYWRGSKPYFLLSDQRLLLRGVPVPSPEPDRFTFEVRGGTGFTWWTRRADAWIAPRSALYRLFRTGVTDTPFLSGIAIRTGLAEVPIEFRAWARTSDAETARAWKVTEQLLIRFRDEVTNAGSEFLVFYVPSQPAVYDGVWERVRRAYAMTDKEWSPAEDADRLARICDRAQIECVIPVDRFRAEASRMTELGSRLYFERDGHWTREGHGFVATILEESLPSSIGGPR